MPCSVQGGCAVGVLACALCPQTTAETDLLLPNHPTGAADAASCLQHSRMGTAVSLRLLFGGPCELTLVGPSGALRAGVHTSQSPPVLLAASARTEWALETELLCRASRGGSALARGTRHHPSLTPCSPVSIPRCGSGCSFAPRFFFLGVGGEGSPAVPAAENKREEQMNSIRCLSLCLPQRPRCEEAVLVSAAWRHPLPAHSPPRSHQARPGAGNQCWTAAKGKHPLDVSRALR